MVKRLLESGESWLRSKLKEIDAVTVTYSRGVQTVDVSATKGQRKAITGEDSGMLLANQVLDFLIERSELLLEGESIRPKPNDRIIVTENGVSEEYRVSNGPNGEDCFEFSDRNHSLYRIHTSYVGIVS